MRTPRFEQAACAKAAQSTGAPTLPAPYRTPHRGARRFEWLLDPVVPPERQLVAAVCLAPATRKALRLDRLLLSGGRRAAAHRGGCGRQRLGRPTAARRAAGGASSTRWALERSAAARTSPSSAAKAPSTAWRTVARSRSWMWRARSSTVTPRRASFGSWRPSSGLAKRRMAGFFHAFDGFFHAFYGFFDVF